MKTSIIVAIDENRAIGKGNKLLWHIPEDLKHFNAVTRGHPIIMGRKTWESLPNKPLKDRYNIVITRDLGFKIKDLRKEDGLVVDSFDEAFKQAQGKPGSEEVFVVGGGQIYQQAMGKNLVDRLYLTIVEGEHEADTFFPDYSEFKKVISEESHESGGYKFKFLTLER